MYLLYKVAASLCVCASVCLYPLFPTQPSDRNQIWHSCVDRSGNGSSIKKLPLSPQGAPGGYFRGSTFQKSGKFHELLRKSVHFLTAHFFNPREGGTAGGRQGGSGVTSQYIHPVHTLYISV